MPGCRPFEKNLGHSNVKRMPGGDLIFSAPELVGERCKTGWQPAIFVQTACATAY
jgi:hypothetical protein